MVFLDRKSYQSFESNTFISAINSFEFNFLYYHTSFGDSTMCEGLIFANFYIPLSFIWLFRHIECNIVYCSLSNISATLILSWCWITRPIDPCVTVYSYDCKFQYCQLNAWNLSFWKYIYMPLAIGSLYNVSKGFSSILIFTAKGNK